MFAVKYDTATGKIAYVSYGTAVSANQAFYANQPDMLVYPSYVDPSTQYVDLSTQTVVPRPVLSPTVSATSVPADGVSTVDISGLPNPTDFELSGPAAATGTTTDGTLQLSFDTPGDYQLVLKAWPHQDYVLSITATPVVLSTLSITYKVL